MNLLFETSGVTRPTSKTSIKPSDMTNFMKKSICWEANCRSTGQEVHARLYNGQVHYSFQKSPPLDRIRNQLNSADIRTPYFLKFKPNGLITYILVYACLPSDIFSLDFPHKILYGMYFSPLRCIYYIPRTFKSVSQNNNTTISHDNNDGEQKWGYSVGSDTITVQSFSSECEISRSTVTDQAMF